MERELVKRILVHALGRIPRHLCSSGRGMRCTILLEHDTDMPYLVFVVDIVVCWLYVVLQSRAESNFYVNLKRTKQKEVVGGCVSVVTSLVVVGCGCVCRRHERSQSARAETTINSLPTERSDNIKIQQFGKRQQWHTTVWPPQASS